MGKYDENISDKSIWLTATPAQPTLALPFYSTEAGHFYAEPDYEVHRVQHDSWLLMYTQNGCGTVTSDGVSVELPIGSAVVIDCHKSHSYAACRDGWEFLWLHIKGCGIKTLFDMLYPNGIFAVGISKPEELAAKTQALIYRICENDIRVTVVLSAELHEIFNTLLEDSLTNEQEKSYRRYSEYVDGAASMLRQRHSEAVTIDEIIKDIPLSKYHFIRVFKRMMGITPYQYLTNYRINSAKILLRTTDLSVSEIADRCGFSDTSNFIAQFKKRTTQKPLCYRQYFRI